MVSLVSFPSKSAPKATIRFLTNCDLDQLVVFLAFYPFYDKKNGYMINLLESASYVFALLNV